MAEVAARLALDTVAAALADGPLTLRCAESQRLATAGGRVSWHSPRLALAGTGTPPLAEAALRLAVDLLTADAQRPHSPATARHGRTTAEPPGPRHDNRGPATIEDQSLPLDPATVEDRALVHVPGWTAPPDHRTTTNSPSTLTPSHEGTTTTAHSREHDDHP